MKREFFNNIRAFAPACLLLLLYTGAPLAGQPPRLKLSPVISSGLNSPIQVVHAGDETQRLFIVQKNGTVKVFHRNNDNLFEDQGQFLALTGILTSGEQGLLSMAFDPGYKTNGYFYLFFTNGSGHLELARFKVSAEDPDIADPESMLSIIVIDHTGQTNHNGGELHFGSDGMLYLSTGDGGGTGDPHRRAQKTNEYLGKLLRIDVRNASPENPYAVPEGNPYGNLVYATGLRNPFRWSFDRTTGDVWIGDVGQSRREEVNYIEAEALARANFGWSCLEAELSYNTDDCSQSASFHAPVYAYLNQPDAKSVIGGVVYRGEAYPDLAGYYIGTDYYSQNLQLILKSGEDFEITTQPTGIAGISDFGESENGELYVTGPGLGRVYRVIIDPEPLPVMLTSFTAGWESRGVLLTWTTANETDFERFDVEYSQDGAGFVTIGTLQAAGAGGSATYTFLHENAGPGENRRYYRLKMTDLDGSFTRSAIVSIAPSLISGRGNHDDNLPAVLPNRITDKTLRLHSPAAAYQELELFNLFGQSIQKNNLYGLTGLMEIKVHHAPPGVYIVRLTGRNKIMFQKVVLAH